MDDTNAKVEHFLALAEEAEGRGDPETALALISRAAQLAPFRSDIREKQAVILEKISDGEHASPADLHRPELRETFIAHHDQKSFATTHLEHTVSAATSNPTATLSRDAAVVRNTQPAAEPLAPIGESPRLRPRMTDTGDDVQMKSELAGAGILRPTSQPHLRRDPTESSRPDKTRQPARAKHRNNVEKENEGADLFAEIKTAGRRISSVGWLARVSPDVKATVLVYFTILVFITTSSIVSYHRLFRNITDNSRMSVSDTTEKGVGSLQASAQPSTISDKEALQVLKLAKDYIRQKRYEEAVNLMNGQLERISDATLRQTFHEELARAYDFMGTALLEKNRLLQSVAAYEKAVCIAPSSPLYLLHLANAHYYCGILLKNENARQYLELAAQEVAQVLEKEPRNLDAYQLQATIYEHTNNTKGAHLALSKIIELAPPTSEEAKLAREKMNKLSFAR
ncbi:MAG: hypothetical protein N2Z21_09615 [Candidatus Sumerlaeaceae bacterium]|nr:hypothetical protein [Candidatus Sumerlaeaceae bacterium]